jgi:hypothetical protein
MNLAKIVLPVLGVSLVLALIGAILLYMPSARARTQSSGFREVLKDGRKRAELSERMNPHGLDKLNDSEVRELVEAYVKTQHQSREYWQVRELKARAIPYLIDVLKRPESFVKPPPKRISDEAPAERALAMLWPNPPDSVIPLLLPRVASHESWERRVAARHLAATGHASATPAVIRLLADDDDWVRSAAVMGLLVAIDAKRAASDLTMAAFEPLKPLVTKKEKAMTGQDAAKLLLRIGRARAIEFLGSSAVISVTNPHLDRVLETLTKEGVRVPAERLLPMFEATFERNYQKDMACGEALKNLALQKHPATENLVENALSESPRPDAAKLPNYLQTQFERRKSAAQALCILNDISDPIETAFSNEEKVGFEKLPVPQQRVILVTHLDGQVGNGGFSQYFFNTDDDPAQVIAALEDIGLSECARAFRGAASVFGKAGPSRNTETRHNQLEKLTANQDQVLATADQQWYAAHKDFGTSIYLYALKHKKDFVPRGRER